MSLYLLYLYIHATLANSMATVAMTRENNVCSNVVTTFRPSPLFTTVLSSVDSIAFACLAFLACQRVLPKMTK